MLRSVQALGSVFIRGVVPALVLASVLVVVPLAHAQANPDKVAATFDRVYVPQGFDSNDVVQIVGEGMFENACYRPAETTVRVDSAAKKIYVGPAAYKYSGLCLQVILPFERTIELGVLAEGNYEIIQDGTGKVLGHLPVKLATRTQPDDYLYAPISQAMFHQKGDRGEIVLQGNFMSSCMSLVDVKVNFQPDAIVVQPIAEMADRSDCQKGSFPFTKVIPVSKMPKGRFLLHVRSMNMKAVNNLVDVK